MKTYTFRIILILVGLLSSAGALSQNIIGSSMISGNVIDSATHKPVEYVTVSLKTDKIIKTVITNADGQFKFTGLNPLAYSLSLVSMGYAPANILADLRDSTRTNIDLGTVYIVPALNKLQEVIITADKPIITQGIDRISYDLQADPESKGSSVLEMARKIPFLSLDAGDNLLMKGKTDYKIFLNGKPSDMMDRNAKEILRSMPASSIKSIEVITSPSVKYDSEGMAGIINIITHKVAGGYNGTLNLNERFPVGGPAIGGSLTFKQNKLGVSVLAGGNDYKSPLTSNSNSRTSDQSNLFQNNTSESASQSGYAIAELSYEIDSLNLFSAQFNINDAVSDAEGRQTSLLNDHNVIKGYDLLNNNTTRGAGSHIVLNYQLSFKADKTKLLTTSYRRQTALNNRDNDLTLSNLVNYSLPDYKQYNSSRSEGQTFQIDYVQQVKKINFEAGLKGLLRNSRSDFQYYSLNSTSGLFESDPSRTNKFDNRQNVFGAYNSYQYSLKNWGIKAGVRVEQTVVDAQFISSSLQIEQNYFNIIPAITINRKLKNNSSITMGFSQSLTRPGVNKLNPYVDRSNPDFETTGNPDLRPVISSRLQLAYSKYGKGSLNVSADYSFANNMELRVSFFDPATNITYSTFQNLGKSSSLDNSINFSYPVTKQWNIGMNANTSFTRTEGVVNNEVLKITRFVYAGSFTTGYKVNDTWRVNGNFRVVGPGLISFQAISNTFTSMSMGVNKDIVKDKLAFSASVNNPFSKYRMSRIETSGPNFAQVSNSQDYFRSFSTSLNYRFGKLKESIKKNKRGLSLGDSN